jgi:hypothetical protein
VPQTKPTPKPINRPNQTEQSRLIEASNFLAGNSPRTLPEFAPASIKGAREPSGRGRLRGLDGGKPWR